MSAKLPDGCRWLVKNKDTIRKSDTWIIRRKHVPASMAIGVGQKYAGVTPCYRRLAAPRKHRFDGTTLGEVVLHYERKWRNLESCRYYLHDYVAVNVAREVRRRDALKKKGYDK